MPPASPLNRMIEIALQLGHWRNSLLAVDPTHHASGTAPGQQVRQDLRTLSGSGPHVRGPADAVHDGRNQYRKRRARADRLRAADHGLPGQRGGADGIRSGQDGRRRSGRRRRLGSGAGRSCERHGRRFVYRGKRCAAAEAGCRKRHQPGGAHGQSYQPDLLPERGSAACRPCSTSS